MDTVRSSFGAPLPPGTREVFELQKGGFRDTAMVPAIPTWQTGTA
jgi:hypothetical protein